MGNKPISPNREQGLVMERKGRMEDLDRSLDVEFWQSQDSGARFSAAWELVVFAYKLKGKDVSELRLQRHIENLQRQSS
jgi:hypothetical protein